MNGLPRVLAAALTAVVGVGLAGLVAPAHPTTVCVTSSADPWRTNPHRGWLPEDRRVETVTRRCP